LIKYARPAYSISRLSTATCPKPNVDVESSPHAKTTPTAEPQGCLSPPHPTVVRTKALLATASQSLKSWKLDDIKYRYTKSAMLFAISILITWVPSSANRVYGIFHPDQPSYALNIATAVVLPSQGFWNGLIFFTTNLPICRRVWRDVREGRRVKVVARIFGKPVLVNTPLANRGIACGKTGPCS
jgi:hypothetical protein